MAKDLRIIYDATPTYNNVCYIFQRLITSLSVATSFKPYKGSWKEFEEVLDIVKQWMIIYDKSKDLNSINTGEVEKIHDILYNLDSKYLACDGLYAEDAYEWILQLKIILKKERKD